VEDSPFPVDELSRRDPHRRTRRTWPRCPYTFRTMAVIAFRRRHASPSVEYMTILCLRAPGREAHGLPRATGSVEQGHVVLFGGRMTLDLETRVREATQINRSGLRRANEVSGEC
jgi:hypothetical protein